MSFESFRLEVEKWNQREMVIPGSQSYRLVSFLVVGSVF